MPRPLRLGEEVANWTSGTVLAITHSDVRSGPDLDHRVKATLDEALEKTAGPATDCSNVGCNGRVHKEVTPLPAMGATFVLPDGRDSNIIPGARFGPVPPPPGKLTPEQARYGFPELTRTGGVWSLRLPNGTERVISWRWEDGSMKITDTAPEGSVTVTPVHAGDVLPLVPGSLDPDARTAEKAVTFDLPDAMRVFIFPTFNETYVGFLPVELRGAIPPAEVLPRGDAIRYGLVPKGDWDGTLPVTPAGGTWTVSLPGGGERTIAWRTGAHEVTVTDTKPSGGRDTLSVPIGHELPLVPFR